MKVSLKSSHGWTTYHLTPLSKNKKRKWWKDLTSISKYGIIEV
jgi:hypothetical protein